MNRFKDESGAAVSVEAVFLYPFTIFVIFWLIYMGLYMFQVVSMQNYAQKIAVLAAREISTPGYLDLPENGSTSTESVFGTLAIDWDVTGNDFNPKVNPGKGLLYRYIIEGGNILSGAEKNQLENIGRSVTEKGGLLVSRNITVRIDVKNYVITQNVAVTISEDIPGMGLVDWITGKNETISATANATANDPDEFVRNVDLAYDAVDWLAEKLHIKGGLHGITEKVKSILEKTFNLGLGNVSSSGAGA